MSYRLARFIDAPLQPGVKRKVAREPFQRLFAEVKILETVSRFSHWLHRAEAGC